MAHQLCSSQCVFTACHNAAFPRLLDTPSQLWERVGKRRLQVLRAAHNRVLYAW